MIKSFSIAILQVIVFSHGVSAQTNKAEMKLRKLDSLHAAAVLSGNLPRMDRFWTKDFMVTNPFNEIDRADRIRNGTVT